MALKNIKYLEYNKNNKQCVNVLWEFLDCIWDDIYNKLNITLDKLEKQKIVVFIFIHMFIIFVIYCSLLKNMLKKRLYVY